MNPALLPATRSSRSVTLSDTSKIFCSVAPSNPLFVDKPVVQIASNPQFWDKDWRKFGPSNPLFLDKKSPELPGSYRHTTNGRLLGPMLGWRGAGPYRFGGFPLQRQLINLSRAPPVRPVKRNHVSGHSLRRRRAPCEKYFALPLICSSSATASMLPHVFTLFY